jgi:hypothetical protein
MRWRLALLRQFFRCKIDHRSSASEGAAGLADRFPADTPQWPIAICFRNELAEYC